MSINDSYDERLPLSPQSNVYITQEKLDSNSSYTHVYLCSVIHQDPIILRNILQKEFSKLNVSSLSTLISTNKNIKLSSYQYLEDKEPFEYQIRHIDFSEAKDPELHLLIPFDAPESKRKQIIFQRKQSINSQLFAYSIIIALFSLLIQLLFIGTLIKEYITFPIELTDDPELIIIRIISFITVGFTCYAEYRYGRLKLNHSIQQGFLYQSGLKRFISGFIGLMQMFSAVLCFSCTTLLITQSKTVLDNVKCLSAMLILSGLDNWVGDYFLHSNKKMQVYTRGVMTQIWCMHKEQSRYCNVYYVFETLVYTGITTLLIYFLFVSLIIFNSLPIDKPIQGSNN